MHQVHTTLFAPRLARVALVCLLAVAESLAPGAEAGVKPRLAAVPPMGWNSWEAFRKELDENALKAQVDAMVNLGLRDAGYVYFVIDGGWKSKERDAKGELEADPKKFPSGMKALADYVHMHGMKFGLHQPAGVRDCGHDEPGSQNNEERDAQLFAAWGVDYIKYDQCDYIHDATRTPGAPDLDKLVLRQGEQVVFTTEAEAPQNHVSGLTRIEERPLCSGGKCVAGLGYAGGAVEVPDVTVKEAGRYTLEVHYAVPYFGQNRDHFKQMTFFVSVNGGARQRVDLAYDLKQRYTMGRVSVEVDLKPGRNRLVLDNPSSQEEDVRLAYVKMASALNRTGREIVFSTSGAPRPWLWAQPVAHLWRTAGDLSPRFAQSILGTVDRQEETLCGAGPGFWADPDSLQFGARSYQETKKGSPPAPMTPSECRAQFSLWAVMAAPLILGMDLRQADDAMLKVILNREVIAVDQDPLGIPGRRILRQGELEVFARRLTDGQAVVLLNRGKEAAEIRVTAADLGRSKQALAVRDLWTGQEQSITNGVISARVEGHGVAMLRLTTGAESKAAKQKPVGKSAAAPAQ
jgi:alpha-galactosidase